MLVIVSALGRAAICLAMAQYVSKAAPEGLLIYPLAFGALVLAKGYAIAKSALVPAVVKDKAELVNANSRLALLSVIAATVGGVPAAGVQHLFGADWSLRVAAVVFVAGRDPRVQDTEGGRPRSRGQQGRRARRSRAAPAEHPARRERDGGAPQQRRLPRVLHRVHAEGRSLRAGRRARGGRGRWIRRRGRGADRPQGRTRGGDRRRVARAARPRSPSSARSSAGPSGSWSPPSPSASVPRRGVSASTACCSATVPMRCEVARSRASRRASSWCG